MILTCLALGNNGWQANVFVFLVEKERKIAVVQPEKQWVWEDGWALMKRYFLTPNFGHSTAELHLKHHHLTRSSSRWPASQRQVSWHLSGLLIGSQGAICPICWLMYVCGCAGPGNGKYCCPKIYFNHRCFSGPYLNKGRIAELPQFIGPGNCVLVLKEVSKRWLLLVKAHTMVEYVEKTSNASVTAAVQKKQSQIIDARMQTIVLSFACVCVCEFSLQIVLENNLTYHSVHCSRTPAVFPVVIATVKS